MAKKVLVAVSGGVDSSTALLLLKQQGYDVAAAHMKLWDYAEVGGDAHYDGRCCSLEAINDLRLICNNLKVPFYVFNFSRQFRERVIENFVAEYKAGRTPNPCVLCNTHLKWENFLQKAQEIGADFIATGHYAIVEYEKSSQRFQLRKGVDDSRDQSYALWGLSQEALARTLFPLGNLRKSEVRELARQFNLRNADRAESREICFIQDDNYRRFLREWEEKRGGGFSVGEIQNSQGKKIGEHQGYPFYTLGQRKGLGISHPTPLYVQRIDPVSNVVQVGEESGLYSLTMQVSDINWVSITAPTASISASTKIRYLHKAASGKVVPLGTRQARVDFDEPQRAITPGQTAVFYRDDLVLGGGIIEKNS